MDGEQTLEFAHLHGHDSIGLYNPDSGIAGLTEHLLSNHFQGRDTRRRGECPVNFFQVLSLLTRFQRQHDFPRYDPVLSSWE